MLNFAVRLVYTTFIIKIIYESAYFVRGVRYAPLANFTKAEAKAVSGDIRRANAF